MIEEIRENLKKNNIDAYILYDYKSQNKVLVKMLGIKQVPTRRIAYILDKNGDDTLIIPAMEQAIFEGLKGITKVYSSHQEFSDLVRSAISEYSNVILDFDEDNVFPGFDIVPHGFVGLLQKINPKIQLEGSLKYIQPFLGNWGDVGYDYHKSAATKLKKIFDAATLELQSKLGNGITEFELRTFILSKFKENDLVSNRYGCLVASEVNSANPHYIPTKNIDRQINRDELVLIDLWAKEDKDGAIYADNTFIIWTGESISEEVKKVWDQVTTGRNMAIQYLKENLPSRIIKGFEVDEIVRNYFGAQSIANYFTHKLGHSLDESVHGLGTHLDSYESYDSRDLNYNCGFTIEPGLYLPGKFGIRSEINAFIDDVGNFEVTSWIQDEIVCIN